MLNDTMTTDPIPTPQPTRYFLTVEWCDNGQRGIFCQPDGACFWKDRGPHTDHEMHTILGPFSVLLSPKSEPLTEEEVAQLTIFRPLAEYSNQYGIALRKEATP